MKELIKKKQELVEQMRSISEKAKSEKRSLTSEERESFDQIETEVRALNAKISLEEDKRQEEIRSRGAAPMEVRKRFVDMVLQSVSDMKGSEISVRAVNTESIFHDASVPVLYQELLQPLEKGLILHDLGVRILFGVQGEPMWPEATAFEASVVGETEKVSDTTLAYKTRKATPKRISASIPVSRRAINQPNFNLYDQIMGGLGMAVARKLNHILCDTTAHGEFKSPFVDIDSSQKIVHGSAGVYTRKDILDIEHLVLDKMIDAMSEKSSFIINTKMMSILENTLESKTSTRFLLERFFENGKRKGGMVGHNTSFSNYVGDGNILFGDFTYLGLPQFGDISIVVDPYSRSTENTVVFTINTEMDMVAIRPEAFGLSSLS